MTSHARDPRLLCAATCAALVTLGSTALAQPQPPEPTQPPAPPPAAQPAPVPTSPAPGDPPPPAAPPPAAEPPAAQPPAAKVEAGYGKEKKPIAGWDKGFYIRSEDGNFLLKIGVRGQTLFTYKIPAVSRDAAIGSSNEAQFSIPRARIALEGHMFTPNLWYKLEADFAKGLPNLKDVVIDYAVVPKWFHLRFGQWKVPFSRQNITSDFEFQFVDRTITQAAFNLDREIGVAINNFYERSPVFEYALGFFNGTGTGSSITADATVDSETHKGSISNAKLTNVPKRPHPTIIARVGYNHGDVKGYGEHDFDGGDPRFGVAASTMIDFHADSKAPGMVRGEADFIFKAYGFSANMAGYLRSVQATDEGATTYDTT
ncbi:MAG: hypothetical protein IT373_15595, partial [Polyangiaceae bacterium]|nr:hypothetical protein [Polyangiaceae bacterium]